MAVNEHTELWKPIKAYEGVYSVSNRGRIRRDLNRTSGKRGTILKPHFIKGGYLRVRLTKNGAWSRKMIARLVTEAFIGPCPPKLQVNHKDGNKLNNCPENLEYVTPKENIHHADALGLRRGPKGEQCVKAILTEKQVKRIRARYAAGGCSYASLAAEHGVARETIGRITRRLNWKHI